MGNHSLISNVRAANRTLESCQLLATRGRPVRVQHSAVYLLPGEEG